MGLSDLDGFVTGIVVGPELILPSEWLPVICAVRNQRSRLKMRCTPFSARSWGRYTEIVACLDTDPDDFDPIFLEGPDMIASDWAGGFLDAVALAFR